MSLLAHPVRRLARLVHRHGTQARRLLARTKPNALPTLGFLRYTSSVSRRSLTPSLSLSRPSPSLLSRTLTTQTTAPPSSPSSSSSTTTNNVILTDACCERIVALNAKREQPVPLRIAVESGGCSGFKYDFFMEEEELEEDDVLIRDERTGAAVVVDPLSLEFLRGATIDYTQEMIRSAFSVAVNPNVDASCGCGVSFTLKT